MDPIVLRAMSKWPNVPDCYGWLALDGRGDWYLRDDAAQQAGNFQSGQPGARGSRLEHAGLINFIQRNYACRPNGAWYFQNGPQRVFVELEVAPWIVRVSSDLGITLHDGAVTSVNASYLDDRGWLYLDTPQGLGRVHTLDMLWAAEAVEQGRWQPEPILYSTLEMRFGFVLSPFAMRY